MPTLDPTTVPTFYPTNTPTTDPTRLPTTSTSLSPTLNPTFVPSNNPTVFPSGNPTAYPTLNPATDPINNREIILAFPTASPTIDQFEDGQVNDAETTNTNDVSQQTKATSSENISLFSDEFILSNWYYFACGIGVVICCLCMVPIIWMCRYKKQETQTKGNEIQDTAGMTITITSLDRVHSRSPTAEVQSITPFGTAPDNLQLQHIQLSATLTDEGGSPASPQSIESHEIEENEDMDEELYFDGGDKGGTAGRTAGNVNDDSLSI